MFIPEYASHEQRKVDGVNSDTHHTHVLQYEEQNVAQPDVSQVRDETYYHLHFHGERPRHHFYRRIQSQFKAQMDESIHFGVGSNVAQQYDVTIVTCIYVCCYP